MGKFRIEFQVQCQLKFKFLKNYSYDNQILISKFHIDMKIIAVSPQSLYLFRKSNFFYLCLFQIPLQFPVDNKSSHQIWWKSSDQKWLAMLRNLEKVSPCWSHPEADRHHNLIISRRSPLTHGHLVVAGCPCLTPTTKFGWQPFSRSWNVCGKTYAPTYTRGWSQIIIPPLSLYKAAQVIICSVQRTIIIIKMYERRRYVQFAEP